MHYLGRFSRRGLDTEEKRKLVKELRSLPAGLRLRLPYLASECALCWNHCWQRPLLPKIVQRICQFGIPESWHLGFERNLNRHQNHQNCKS